MPLGTVTEPVTVLHRAAYGEDVTYRSGAPIEALKVMDASGDIHENLTLAEDLDGAEALKPGAVVRLVLAIKHELVARTGANGRNYVTGKHKFRVTGLAPAR